MRPAITSQGSAPTGRLVSIPMATRPMARHALRAELAWGAGTIVLSLILAAIALHLWDANLRIPFSYSSDANQNQLIVKGVLDHGWYQHNPSLGFPFGQTLYDFPVVSGDNLQIVLMKVIGIFTSDSALVINLFFLLTFPLTAGIAYACTRLLGVSRPGSALVAVLFAIAPYHFIRGERHLFIAAYYAVPIGAYLAVRAIRGESFGRRQFGWLALAVIVVGSAHVYYAAFAMGLLATAALVRVIVREPRTATTAVALFAAIGAVVVANHLPNIVYRAQHGQNQSLERPPIESESYGLKMAAMVLPVEEHRIPALAHLRKRYDGDSEQLQEGQPQALGLVATLGFLGLIAAALVALAVPERRTLTRSLVLPLAALTLAAFLIATVGGFSSVFAYIVTPQLRAWARMSTFIAFFSLVAVALAAQWVGVRRGARAAIGAMAAVLVIGFLDQTNGGSVPDYQFVDAAYRSDAAFVGGIEHTLRPGA